MVELTQDSHGSGMTSERTRLRMVERLREKGITDERVLAVLAELPRHLFVDPALASRAYDDIALPIAYGQTISQPYIVARMTELVVAKKPRKVLEIGTGCGYQTAVLAKLVPDIYSVERIGGLLDRARHNLRHVKLVHPRLSHVDGTTGLPASGPFDAILVTAAAPYIPDALVEQLAIGGRLIVPQGVQEQYLWLIERTATGRQDTRLEAVKFVPLLGGKI